MVGPNLDLKLRHEPRDAVGVLLLPRPRLNAMSHVTPAALFVGGKLRAPDAQGGRELGPVPVGGVAYALDGQRVAGVSAFAVAELSDNRPLPAFFAICHRGTLRYFSRADIGH